MNARGNNETTALMVLKQTGAEITETVGPNEDEQYPIRKGKIEGDKITAESDNDGHTIRLDLKFVSGRITGEAQMTRDGQSMRAKIDVGRAK